MTRIIRSKDCGNSPKNVFAEDIALALEKQDKVFLIEVFEPNLAWENGNETLSGQEACVAQLAKLKKPTKIKIDHVVTHGKSGAVNGTSWHGKSEPRRFCHILEFANARCKTLARICTYS